MCNKAYKKCALKIRNFVGQFLCIGIVPTPHFLRFYISKGFLFFFFTIAKFSYRKGLPIWRWKCSDIYLFYFYCSLEIAYPFQDKKYTIPYRYAFLEKWKSLLKKRDTFAYENWYLIDLDIYFWLRFGLANAINDYQRLNIHVVCVGNL